MFCSNNCKKLVLIKMGCWAAQSAVGRHTVLYVRLGDHRPYVVGADRKAHGGGGRGQGRRGGSWGSLAHGRKIAAQKSRARVARPPKYETYTNCSCVKHETKHKTRKKFRKVVLKQSGCVKKRSCLSIKTILKKYKFCTHCFVKNT